MEVSRTVIQTHPLHELQSMNRATEIHHPLHHTERGLDSSGGGGDRGERGDTIAVPQLLTRASSPGVLLFISRLLSVTAVAPEEEMCCDHETRQGASVRTRDHSEAFPLPLLLGLLPLPVSLLRLLLLLLPLHRRISDRRRSRGIQIDLRNLCDPNPRDTGHRRLERGFCHGLSFCSGRCLVVVMVVVMGMVGMP